MADVTSPGRNVSLFNAVRLHARRFQVTDAQIILNEAIRVNAHFAIPLPRSEVAATARSIAKYMNRLDRRPRGSAASSRGPKRGRDARLGEGLTTPQKRCLAGQRTATLRATQTSQRIKAAAFALAERGERITQASIAKQASLSVRTVASRWGTQRITFGDGINPDLQNGALSGLGASSGEEITLGAVAAGQANAAHRYRVAERTVSKLLACKERHSRRGARIYDVPEAPEAVRDDPVIQLTLRAAIVARNEAIRRANVRRAKTDRGRRISAIRKLARRVEGERILQDRLENIVEEWGMRIRGTHGSYHKYLCQARNKVIWNSLSHFSLALEELQAKKGGPISRSRHLTWMSVMFSKLVPSPRTGDSAILTSDKSGSWQDLAAVWRRWNGAE
ncbi:hypothetical protein ACLF3G_26380 [Falsiroseomonas sp. HC035]|uniref:hypothetical protein n=1 Tax=Falsiroseomonas sp. HC035 TaxID=3390999 RepID=UPI003D31B534